MNSSAKLLHKSERGKEAAIAVQTGASAAPTYAPATNAATDLAGIDRLGNNEDSSDNASDDGDDEVEDEEGDEVEDEVEDDEEEDGDEDEDDDEEGDDDEEIEDDDASNDEEESELKKVSIAAERVLTDEDFKRMRKRKRDDSSDSESADDTFTAVNPEHLLPSKKMRSSMSKKEQRVASIKDGRTDKTLFKKRDRRGGSTNKEKVRNKPVMMTNEKRKRKSMLMSAHEKMKQLKKHIKTIKKVEGGVTKRRRAR